MVVSDADADATSVSSQVSALGVQWFPEQIRGVVSDRLELVKCDGDTVLVTLPVPRKISALVHSVSTAYALLPWLAPCGTACGSLWLIC